MSDPNKGKADVAALHHMIDAMAGAIDPIVMAHAESELAHAEKLEAQVALVTLILDLARPTVHALGTRPKISEAQSTNNDGSGPVTKLASWRGLVLTCPAKKIRPSNGEPSPMTITTAAEVSRSGSYGGEHVFVRDDGSLIELSYKGCWSTQLGGVDEWRATEREISVKVFCQEWSSAADPKKLATQLADFMDAAGDRRKATGKARDLTSKFRAITALL